MRFPNFFKKQYHDIKGNGFKILYEKFIYLFEKEICFYLLFPFLVLFLLVLTLLSPLVTVRFGLVDNGRIGHLYQLRWYLTMRESRQIKKKWDFFFFHSSTGVDANPQWSAMFKRQVHVIPFFPTFVRYVKRVTLVMNGFGKAHLVHHQHVAATSTQNRDLLKLVHELSHPVISFTKEEIDHGERLLSEMGIPSGAPIFCFHNRDSAYLNQVKPDINWAYHDYRDSYVGNYIKSAEYFADQGFYSIRMGAIVQDKAASSHLRVIDYASSKSRSDFLDVYLGFRCQYFLASDTGVTIIPETFLRPVVYTNWVFVGKMSLWVPRCIVIPKKIFSKRLKRLLTFDEVINDSTFANSNTQNIKDNYDLFENTSEEILDACLEMEARLKNTWVETDEDRLSQQVFWDIFGRQYERPKNLYIGAKFLRDNKELLRRASKG